MGLDSTSYPDAGERKNKKLPRSRIPSSDLRLRLADSPTAIPLADEVLNRHNYRAYSFNRAGDRIRTDDLLLTRQLLYQLSYASETYFLPVVKPFLTSSAVTELTSVHVGVHVRASQRTSRSSPASNTTRKIVSASACW